MISMVSASLSREAGRQTSRSGLGPGEGFVRSRCPRGIGHEGNLSVVDFQQEVAVAFIESLDFRLAGRLREKIVAFSSDRQNESSGGFIFADIAIKHRGIHPRLLVLLAEQVQAQRSLRQGSFSITPALAPALAPGLAPARLAIATTVRLSPKLRRISIVMPCHAPTCSLG
jgi:hypothetical protein